MYGPHIGTLNVFVKSVALNGSQTVWTKSLNQGNKWVLGEVTIPQVYTNYQVRYGCVYNIKIRSKISKNPAPNAFNNYIF